MKIRDFKESDAEKVAALSNSNSEFFQYPHITPDFIKKMCAHPRYALFVAGEGDEILGFCGANFKGLPLAEIGPLCVDQTKRLQGLGRLLVTTVFDFLSGMGAKKVIIKVKESNKRGQDFFTSLGFEKDGRFWDGKVNVLIMQHGLKGDEGAH